MRPGRLAAAIVIACLAAGAAYAATRDGPAQDPASEFSQRPPTSSPAAPSSHETEAADRNPPSPTTTHSPTVRDPLVVVSEGLEAWGRFAVSGDLGTVAPWFSEDGPQWRQFEKEAPELADDPSGSPPYSVVFDEERISQGDGVVTVEGRVRFVRTGEPTQRFRWEILLRAADDGWQIWTVTGSQTDSSAPSMSRP